MIGIAQPFYTNAVGKIPTIWFPEHQRAMATSFGALAQPFGAIVALAIGPIYVKKGTSDKEEV